MQTFLYTLGATGFTWAMTCVGAALVFFFKDKPSPLFTKISLGFAAGIMIAASVWSLLIPAMDAATEMGWHPTLPVAGGFVLGIAFLILLDNVLPHQHIDESKPEGPHSDLNRSQLLFLAITIHNIPEGMAVGIAIVAAMASGQPEVMSAALILALGMGIQNIPEGTAVTLPIHSNGVKRSKAFLFGVLSGVVEPISALIVVSLAAYFIPIMPWLLSFAAGAMMYVVVEELIPEARLGEHSDKGTLAVLAGFLLMMILDTTLGA